MAESVIGPLTDLRIVDGPVPADDCSGVGLHVPAHGAVASFVGVVRDHHRGRGVTRIHYQCYAEMAVPVLGALTGAVRAEHGGDLAVRVVHATGRVDPGEPAVAIHCASGHREAAFAACRALLEAIKRELPVWKHEHYVDGESAWLEGS